MRTLDFGSQIVVISCGVEQVSISGMLAVWFERSSLAHLVSLPMVLWEQVVSVSMLCGARDHAWHNSFHSPHHTR